MSEEAFMANTLRGWDRRKKLSTRHIATKRTMTTARNWQWDAVLGPADVGGAHRPYAPQQQDGEDEAEHDGGTAEGEAAVGLEGGDLIGGGRHGDGSSSSGAVAADVVADQRDGIARLARWGRGSPAGRRGRV